MKLRTIAIQVRSDADDEQLIEMIGQCLAIGQADAVATVEDAGNHEQSTVEQAQDAADMEIESLSILHC